VLLQGLNRADGAMCVSVGDVQGFRALSIDRSLDREQWCSPRACLVMELFRPCLISGCFGVAVTISRLAPFHQRRTAPGPLTT